MSVIIDEFEVVMDSQQERDTSSGETETAAAPAPGSMKPQDISAVFTQHQLRCERVRAH